MDKTHNISLGGLAFAIDDAAYHILRKYLNDIRISLHNSGGVDEIMADVEYRMAELLRERMSAREVVNQNDVDYLIGVMGKPEDYYTEDFTEENTANAAGSSSYSHTYSGVKSKKLFRDPDNKMLGGVCSGLGHYFGIDATWVRIITVVLLFVDPIFFSVGSTIFIAYFILWLVVPEAKTTSDKLLMRGEPVNFDSIKDFFGNSPEAVRNNIKDFGNDARRVASESGSAIGNILRLLLKLFGIFILGILLIIALSLLVAFVATILGLGGALFGVGIAGFSLNDYFPYVFEGDWEKWIAYISLGLVMILPAVGLILLILRLISKRYRVPRAVGFSLPLLWLAGLIGLTIITVTTLRNFQQSAHDIKTVNLPTAASTLIVEQQENDRDWENNELLTIRPGYLGFDVEDDIYVKKSETGNAYMELKFTSKGRTVENAIHHLKALDYKYEVNDSLVKLDNHLFIKGNGGKWRNQKVRPVLYLPEGKQVKINNMDVHGPGENEDYWGYDSSGNIYKFVGDKFTCVNCPKEDTVVTHETDSTATGAVIKVKTDEDSIIIKTGKNGTGNISISAESDSISN